MLNAHLYSPCTAHGPDLKIADINSPKPHALPFVFPPLDFNSSSDPGTLIETSSTPDISKKPGPSKSLEKCSQDHQTPHGNIYSVKYWLILHLLRLLRNLWAHDWIQSNPLGTTAEFKIYYDNLYTEDKKVCPGSCQNC